MTAVVGRIDIDAAVAMRFHLDVNARLALRGVAPLRGRYQTTEAHDALVAGESAESFVAWYVARETAPCGDCGHDYRAHGPVSRACLTMIGGRFDGAADQTRCRCKRFLPSTTATTAASAAGV